MNPRDVRAVNVLLLSAGRRVELIRSFRNAYRELGLAGSIIAADADPLAPALREADRSWLVPRLDDPSFLSVLLQRCRAEGISLVVPLTDRDIPVLVRHRRAVEEAGPRVVLGPDQAVAIASDKLLTNGFFMEHGIPAPRSWSADVALTIDHAYPVFIRPRGGSGGEHAYAARNERELRFFLDYVADPIVQELLPGPEITTDVFSDFGARVLGAVPRQRLEVRWGEVSKGVTIRDPAILRWSMEIAEKLRATGPITVQCMLREGRPYFTEVNLRFGGGAPLGIAAGVDGPKWLLALAAGLDPGAPPIGTYTADLYLTRFDSSFVFREEDCGGPSGRVV